MTPRNSPHFHLGTWFRGNIIHFTTAGPHNHREDRLPLLFPGTEVVEYRSLARDRKQEGQRKLDGTMHKRLISELESNAAGK